MSEKKPGLPKNFELQVDKPVDLGDYLDEGFGGALAAPAVKTSDQVEHRSEVVHSSETRSPHSKSGDPTKKTRKKEPPRKQINMKPETLQKAEELLEIIRHRGPQRDTAASEMFEAMVSAFHDAREQIDLSEVPKRGRWGTPTAECFLDELSEKLKMAIRQETL